MPPASAEDHDRPPDAPVDEKNEEKDERDLVRGFQEPYEDLKSTTRETGRISPSKSDGTPVSDTSAGYTGLRSCSAGLGPTTAGGGTCVRTSPRLPDGQQSREAPVSDVRSPVPRFSRARAPGFGQRCTTEEPTEATRRLEMGVSPDRLGVFFDGESHGPEGMMVMPIIDT